MNEILSQSPTRAIFPHFSAKFQDAGSDSNLAGIASAKPLGNITNSRHAFWDEIDPSSGVIITFVLDEIRREYVQKSDVSELSSASRRARFSAQTAASKLFAKLKTPRGGQWRVCGCTRRKIGEFVAVLYAATIKKAHYNGVMTCASVWTCPVCAAKISERRKHEIKQVTDIHAAAGGGLYMLTFTFPHGRADVLADMIAQFSAAKLYLRKSRGYKNLMKKFSYVGDIRTLELTFGDANGYHPHEHNLWLTTAKLTRSELRAFTAALFPLWLTACLKSGLQAPSRKRGLTIIECESAAAYMAKFGREQTWGISSELSKQHVKSGKAKSMSPFDLLRSYEAGNKEHGARFIEYAEAFFGKRQIVWSDGLKSVFGIGEKTDEELEAEELDSAELLIKINSDEWKKILHSKFDIRGYVLELAESGGFDSVRDFLDNHLVL